MGAAEFKLMAVFKRISEKINPKIKKRIKEFNIKEGMTVVDYGCGPGMYIYEFSKSVGENGKVFAVDIAKEARKEIEKIKTKYKINNVHFYSAEGYNSNMNGVIADIVFALDIFHGIEDKRTFLAELYRHSVIPNAIPRIPHKVF